MGVDWLTCNNCGDTFPDCGDFVWCGCGEAWCSYECAEAEGYKYEVDEDGDEIGTCKYCRKEDFDDSTLLNFILKGAGISREEVIAKYKEDNKMA